MASLQYGDLVTYDSLYSYGAGHATRAVRISVRGLPRHWHVRMRTNRY